MLQNFKPTFLVSVYSRSYLASQDNLVFCSSSHYFARMAPDKPHYIPKEISPALEQCYLVDDTIVDPVLGKNWVPPPEKKKHPKKPKKHNPQTKLKQFFPTKLNYQGKPFHQCVYEQVVSDFVWVPPKYKDKIDNVSTYYGVKWDMCEIKPIQLCLTCELKPCMASGCYNSIMDYSRVVEKEVGDDNTALVKQKVAEKMMRDHCKLFGNRYSKKLPLLHCFAVFCDCMYDDPNEMGDDSGSDSDEEFWHVEATQFQSFQKKCFAIDRMEMRRRKKKARESMQSSKKARIDTGSSKDAASSPATAATTSNTDESSDEEAEL